MPVPSFYMISACALAVERISYGIVFHFPEKTANALARAGFKRGSEPETIFQFCGVFKIVQFIVFFSWARQALGGLFFQEAISMISMQILILSGLLFFVGQLLNAFVWRKIGIDGVCYGNKFGRELAWCDEFPYGPYGLSDPQYVGCVLTVWGMFLLTSPFTPEWFVLPLIETFLYWLSIVFLEHSDEAIQSRKLEKSVSVDSMSSLSL